jgi:molybdate transport system substrate-binding protein
MLSASFAKATGIRVRFVFAASGVLARQIENGAPYDVYLSANERFTKELADRGKLLSDTVRVYALGRIALWSKSASIRTLENLAQPGIQHIAIPNPQHAPYGKAAREALVKRGLWEQVKARVVYGENVQQTLQYAQSGNAEAAITAWSLVLDKGGIVLPADWHDPIRQSGGVVKSTRNAAAARIFLDFLTGREGKAILEKYGL